MLSEIDRIILLADASKAGYDRAEPHDEDTQRTFGQIAMAGGGIVYDALAPKLAAVEEREQANWAYLRDTRAINERLRETLQKIVDGDYASEDINDCPSDVAPHAWLARKALDAKAIVEQAAAPPWEPIDDRHKTGLWVVAIHEDLPERQQIARWIRSEGAPLTGRSACPVWIGSIVPTTRSRTPPSAAHRRAKSMR